MLHKQSYVIFHGVLRLCRQANLVLNQALYYLRQSFFNGDLMSWASADKHLKFHHGQLYNNLPAAMSQAIIKKLDDAFSSFLTPIRLMLLPWGNSKQVLSCPDIAKTPPWRFSYFNCYALKPASFTF